MSDIEANRAYLGKSVLNVHEEVSDIYRVQQNKLKEHKVSFNRHPKPVRNYRQLSFHPILITTVMRVCCSAGVPL